MLTPILRRNRFLLVLAVLLTWAGLGLNILLIPYSPPIDLGLINLTPGAMMGATWYLAGRFYRRRWIPILLGFFATLAAIAFVLLSNLAYLVLSSSALTVTDVSRYEEVRSLYESADLVNHFPASIPPEATNVAFYYFPGMLQGGMTLQLRLQLPAAQWEARRTEYESVIQYRWAGSELSSEPDPHADKLFLIPAFHTGETTDLAFPDTYDIWILAARSQGTPEWNHGYSYGMAFKAEPPEIVYWAKDW